ncbi:hypothetical protein [Pseudoalteromonas obscura]|uniref:Uncharacterized protein n=1 Tax=Pseudoalteromonas obscura TaxID=3048491 RepID=A0ABT7ES87_9GAMM|nr:hypothetical protein [Pseudoalteromonas sp. P94(2023)]MDK2597873.1 hypothetical protein [Pseudoalteromonas sp. P94(2023)]
MNIYLCWFLLIYSGFSLTSEKNLDIHENSALSDVTTQVSKFFVMLGKGTQWHVAHDGGRRLVINILSALRGSGDRSVEMFECLDVVGKRRHPYMVVYRHADIDGPVACGKYGMWNTYATGFYYQDEGDDRIIYMKCSLLIA